MNINSLLNLQGTLFLLVAAGVVLRRTHILPKEARSVLTDLVIDLILPCNIINSFRIAFDMEVLKGFAFMLIIATLIQFACLFFAKTLYNKEDIRKKKVLQYGTVCSNAGFMGNPIAEGIFGSMGLMYASVFLIPQRIVMWSAGVSYFTESPDRKTVIKKVATHPCIVAVYIGVFLLVTQMPLPGFIGDTVKSISNCTTTMSMLLIGTILAEVDPKSIIDFSVIKYAAIRLILIPLVVLIPCRLLHVDTLLTGVAVLLTGMPAGSTTAILAAKYDGDYLFATKCVVVTTVLSLITVPMWCLLL